MHLELNISRFWLLLKMELFRSRKAVLVTLLITFGGLFLIDLLLLTQLGENGELYRHDENFALSLLVGGFLLSSLTFHDLSNSLNRSRYLNLPASNLEKFISMWLLSSIGWMVLFTLTYSLYTLLANRLGQVFFPQVTFIPFDPLGDYAANSLRSYIALQGLFLLGAVQFRGYVFPKTLLTLFLFVGLCIGIIYFVLVEVFTSEHVCTEDGCELVDAVQLHPIWEGLSWLFWWALAPLCWFTAYLGLKEQEV